MQSHYDEIQQTPQSDAAAVTFIHIISLNYTMHRNEAKKCRYLAATRGDIYTKIIYTLVGICLNLVLKSIIHLFRVQKQGIMTLKGLKHTRISLHCDI